MIFDFIMIYYNQIYKMDKIMNINKWIEQNKKFIENKRIVITGTTSGLGLATLTHLFKMNAKIVVSTKNIQVARNQIAELKEKFPNNFAEAIELDLSNEHSIVEFSGKVKQIFADGIDALINNAGIYAQKQRVLENGFEQHFFINCLAPILLSNLLLTKLEKRKNSKLVFVSSISISGKMPNFDNFDLKGESGDIKIYGNSKIWLTLFALELKRELKKRNSNTDVNICQPGISATSLMHYSHGKFGKFAFKIISGGMKILFPKKEKACLVEIYSIFSNTNDCEWISPSGHTNVYGFPKTKKLKLNKNVFACRTKCYNIISDLTNKLK